MSDKGIRGYLNIYEELKEGVDCPICGVDQWYSYIGSLPGSFYIGKNFVQKYKCAVCGYRREDGGYDKSCIREEE